jgi:murein DD-endopeptidase MepM/ murein hydrolase activator NlpD
MPHRAILSACLAVIVCLSPAPQSADAASGGRGPGIPPRAEWAWPIWPASIERGYVQPSHRYAPGHRGVDLRPTDDETPVRAPAGGIVAFAGSVAGRPLVTIDHGDGLVTTLEPVEPSVAVGAPVARGQELGVIAAGGHTTPGAVHFGVRLHDEYINPLLLLVGVPRAVLLPCCE